MGINKKYIDADELCKLIDEHKERVVIDDRRLEDFYAAAHDHIKDIIHILPPANVIEPPPKKKQKVYIAGKMTGDNHYREKFADAHKALERLGYIVLDPSNNPAGMDYSDYMTICFAMIDVADVVAFLPDWKESKGATLEHSYCEYIDKPMMNLLEY